MRRLRHSGDRGTKLTGEPSLDLCTYCYSFRCDPMVMSAKFADKVSDRLRQHRCPACGKPEQFCSCKSVLDSHGEPKRVATHNNKKLRRAEERIRRRERAFHIWRSNQESIAPILGDEVCADIYVALRNHDVPDQPLNAILPMLKGLRLDLDALSYGWATEGRAGR